LPRLSELIVPLPETEAVKRFALRLALWIGAAYLVFLTRDIWLPLGAAFLIAMVLDPVVDRMQSRGWSRLWGTAFIYASFLLITGGLIVLATPYLVHQFTELGKGFGRYFPDSSHAGLVRSFERMNVPDWVGTIGVRTIEGIQSGLARSSTWLTEYGMRFVSNLVWLAIVPIVSFYALRDFHLILTKMLLLVPTERRDSVQAAVGEVTEVFAKYLRGLFLVSLMNGSATWLLLWALHVPSPLLLGVVAGVLYTVPYIGAMITIVLTAAVAFVGGGIDLLLVAVGASLVLHQVIFDQVISPRVVGGHVGLHPIISIVALLVGNLLLGVAGMVLAVPVAACIQIAVLGLVPKLNQEIPERLQEAIHEASAAAQTTQGQTTAADASAEMHAAVSAAVEHIEAAQAEEDAAND